MSLQTLYQELHRRAAETGKKRGQTLTGGARLTVRVVGDVTTLTISRKGKLVGDTELATFRAACGVPETAERRPNVGQNRMIHEEEYWYYLSFRWTVATEEA